MLNSCDVLGVHVYKTTKLFVETCIVALNWKLYKYWANLGFPFDKQSDLINI